MSDFEDLVPEHVEHLGVSSRDYALLVRTVEVDVPVQPQLRPVTVHHPDEGLEPDVGVVFRVPETEWRRVGDEDAGFLPPEETAPSYPGGEGARPAAHLALRVLVGAAGVQARPGEPSQQDAIALLILHLHDPAVQRRASAGVLGAGGIWVVVAEDVVDGDAEEGDQVLQVGEGKVAAGDHSFDVPGVGVEARSLEYRLHPVADAQDLHARRFTISWSALRPTGTTPP